MFYAMYKSMLYQSILGLGEKKMEKYYNAFAEVDAILDYLVEEDYNKIPQEIIDSIIDWV